MSCKSGNSPVNQKIGADSSSYFSDYENSDLIKQAKQYKLANAAAGQDSLWTHRFIFLYDSLEALNNPQRLFFLQTVADQDSLTAADKNVDIDVFKALCNLAYENEKNLPVYIKFLERASLHSNALNILGVDYKTWLYLNLGEKYTMLNDNISGLQYLNKYFLLANTIVDNNAKQTHLVKSAYSMANTYRNIGQFDSALRYCRIAVSVKSARNAEKAYAHAELAEIYNDMGEVNLAVVPAKQAIALLNAENEKEEKFVQRKAVVYSIMADIAFAKNDWKQTSVYVKKASSLFDSLYEPVSREKGKLMLTYAKAWLAQSNTDSAIHYCNVALQNVLIFAPSGIYDLPLKENITAENTVYEAMDLKADILTLLFKKSKEKQFLENAISAYDLSFSAEDSLTRYFLNTTSTLKQMQESRFRSQKAIAICYLLYQYTKSDYWVEKAFQFAERNKAFVLLESVKRNLAANKGLLSDSTYKKTLSLQLQLAYYKNEINSEKNDSVKTILLQQINNVEEDLLSAKTILIRQNNVYKSVMEKEDSISIGKVKTKLADAETAVVEFFAGDSVTYGFVFINNLPCKFIRYSNNLSSDIDSYVNFFSNRSAILNNPMAFKATAFNLYNTLNLQQFTTACKKLIIIPDGKLNFVPFDALITQKENNADLKEAAYLIKKINPVYSYSTSILIHQQATMPYKNNSVLAFAPVFPNGENKQSALAFSQKEVEAISSKQLTTYIKGQATLTNFKQGFENAGIIHIASHAIVDTSVNDNNRVVFIDSSLYLNELYAMHTNANLVVLSACETGIGVIDKGEGAMSLARGFYYAGAKNVITSLWSVDDRSTAGLFGDFYQHLSGNNYAASLYAAKLNYLKNASAANASPYYWAGFVHIGYQKQQQKNYAVLFVASAVLLISLLSYHLYRRRTK